MDLEKRITTLENKMQSVVSTLKAFNALTDMQALLLDELTDAFCELADMHLYKNNPKLEKYYQAVKKQKNNFKVHRIQEEE